MTARHLAVAALAFIVLCLSGPLQAAPYGPDGKLTEFAQPNGTKISLRVFGDEFYARTETLDGYTVVFDPAARAYFYAKLSADGARLESTSVMVGGPVPKSLMLEKSVAIDPAVAAAQARAARSLWEQQTGIRERWESLKTKRRALEAGGPSTKAPPSFPTLGNKVGLTLLIDFSDDPATVPQAEIVNFLNGDAYTGYGNNGSVKQYFLDNSDGKLTYTNVVTAYIRMVRPKSYYNDITKDCGDQGNLLIKDALDILKASPAYATEILPRFSALTVDGSNRVVACNVFYAGGNGGRWTFGLWPHSWSLYNVGSQELSVGGMKVWNYQITDIGTSLELGTFCHENGHMLCDYPDIYDYGFDSVGGAGVFCLMNSGGHGVNPSLICAYLKNAAGWATVTDIDKSSGVRRATLTAAPGAAGYNHFYRYRKPGSTTEYFLLENRQRSGRDARLPSSGIAIWHVDERGDHSNQSLVPNSLNRNYEVTLKQADNLWHFQRNVNSGDANDLYYSGNTAAAYTGTFNDASAPHARWWDGADSGLKLKNFSASGPVMTVDVDLFLAPPTVKITAPAQGSFITPGLDVQVAVSATDVAADGTPGSVSQVELLVDNVPVAADTSAPYNFTYSPPQPGTYKLTAVATDNEGESAEDSVTIEYRYPPPGTVVEPFNPPVADGPVQTLAADSVGRIYVGGNFTKLNGSVHAPGLARLRADGVPDRNGFFPGTGANAQVRALAFSAKDKALYVGGAFSQFDGLNRRALAKLSIGQVGRNDGSLDASFDPQIEGMNPSDPVYLQSIVVQHDGKILVGGSFSSVLGQERSNLARLMPDGSLDATFAPNPNGPVNAIVVQPDGKILIGGAFSSLNGVPGFGRVARLQRDGSIDASFQTGTGFNDTVTAVTVALDGEIFVGGLFTAYNGFVGYNRLAKLSATGVLDRHFNASPGLNNEVSDLLLRSNGSILVSGYFSSFGNSAQRVSTSPVGRVMQVNSAGMIDIGFNPAQVGANGPVIDAITLPAGEILLAGAFSSFNGAPRQSLAVVSGFSQDAPGVTSQPYRNISAGENLDEYFTASANGSFTLVDAGGIVQAPESLLPRGVRFDASTGRLHGVPLDSGAHNIYVRFQSTSGGTSTTRYLLYVNTAKVPYGQWRKAWFTDPVDVVDDEVSGPSAVRNGVGANNLMVYALDGGNPSTMNMARMPSVGLERFNRKDYLTLRSSIYSGAQTVVRPELSLDLSTWTSDSSHLSVSDTGIGVVARPVVPAAEAEKQFLRLKIAPQ